MWEDYRKKRLIMNIILAVVILAVLAGLLLAMIYVRRQTKEHDEHLSEIYMQQQQEQAEARQESVDAIQIEYDRDMQTVAEYLPGIVCWGDSITLGSMGNISYPSILKLYLDTYFCDIYDFRSTIPNADDYARLKWEDYKVDVPVVNMGADKESSYTVLGRCGAMPYVLKSDLKIPAGTEPVRINLVSQNGNSVQPLKGGDVGVNPVSIGGIEGTLSMQTDSYYTNYYFTRSQPGDEVVLSRDTVVHAAASDLYRDYIHVVCIGTYGRFNSADDLVNQIRQILARQAQNPERYLVLGLCTVNGSSYDTFTLDAMDKAMMQAFGNRFINVRKYLIEEGFADAGITPEKEDQGNIKANRVPPSFLAGGSGTELNGQAYKLLGRLVYTTMENLGYFDEVFDELGIKETTKQILKEDPTYFETILKNSMK